MPYQTMFGRFQTGKPLVSPELLKRVPRREIISAIFHRRNCVQSDLTGPGRKAAVLAHKRCGCLFSAYAPVRVSSFGSSRRQADHAHSVHSQRGIERRL